MREKDRRGGGRGAIEVGGRVIEGTRREREWIGGIKRGGKDEGRK